MKEVVLKAWQSQFEGQENAVYKYSNGKRLKEVAKPPIAEKGGLKWTLNSIPTQILSHLPMLLAHFWDFLPIYKVIAGRTDPYAPLILRLHKDHLLVYAVHLQILDFFSTKAVLKLMCDTDHYLAVFDKKQRKVGKPG